MTEENNQAVPIEAKPIEAKPIEKGTSWKAAAVFRVSRDKDGRITSYAKTSEAFFRALSSTYAPSSCYIGAQGLETATRCHSPGSPSELAEAARSDGMARVLFCKQASAPDGATCFTDRAIPRSVLRDMVLRVETFIRTFSEEHLRPFSASITLNVVEQSSAPVKVQ